MTAIRNQRGGVRRGVSIAAAALSLALVAPAIQPVQGGVAPLASAQGATTQASGDYVPANVGRVFDEGKDLRYAGLAPVSVKDETDGTDFKLQVPHWLVKDRTGFLTGGSKEDPDASKAVLRFQDKALYSQIDRISGVGENNDKQGDFVKRDPNGSEWSLDLSTVKNFPGSAGKNYSSFYKIYLNNGVEVSSLQDAGDGFAVTQYWIRQDGRIVKNSVSRALLSTDGKLPPSMPKTVFDGSKDAAAGSQNILNRPVSKFVSYDQGKNEINSIIWLPMTQNFLQASYDWAWQLEEQIDPALIPFIDSVVVYSSDKDGNLSKQNRTQFELAVDSERNVVTTTQNKQLTWGKDDADITGATDPRFKEVRNNWDNILYGTLGQSRPITIKYKLKDGALEGIQNATGGYVDFASWINADVFDKLDGGAPVDVLKNSYGYTYLSLSDIDGDGLLDSYESELGTDSSKFDTDGDGVPDGQEVLKDKTDPKNPGSYKPSTPDPEMTKIRTNDTDFKVSVPKEIFKDKNDNNVPVTSDDTKLTVALVPESAVTTDPQTDATKVDLDKAVGKTELPRTAVEKGDANITGISGVENGVKYKAVAITPNGEVAVSEKTIEGTDQPIEKTRTPEVAPVTTNDEKITVTAEKGSEVKIELPDGTVLVPKEDANKPGTFTASIPKQMKDAQIKVTAQAPDKTKSDTQTVTVTEAAQPKTTVSGTPKAVNPTADKQDTGLKVANKDKDTKVTAKDEDGNDIPVTIKDDGTVE
ncbi:Ig-like domain-containing protein, partial [Corynebacterium pyruviciproducens]